MGPAAVYPMGMIRTLARISAAILLAALVAATSLSMAVVRGQTRIAGEIVICTGYGIATIAVDANGNPTGPAHLCPDMVLGLMAALEAAPPVLMRPEGDVRRLDVLEPKGGAARAMPHARARGPPVLA